MTSLFNLSAAVIILLSFSSRVLTSQTKTIKPEYDTTLAQRYYDQGLNFQKKGNYDSAVVYFEKAGKIYWYLHEKKHLAKLLNSKEEWATEKYVDCMNKMGINHEYKKNHNKALDILQKNVVFAGNYLHEKNISVATLYNALGMVYESLGMHDKALNSYQKALDLRLDLFGQKHGSITGSYNNIGNTYHSLGEYDLALMYYTRALNLGIELLGTKHLNIAFYYNNLGIGYQFKGDYIKALDNYSQALNIFTEVLGINHPNIAVCYNNIGITYQVNGEYQEALKFFFKALSLFREIGGEEQVSVSEVYNNIGIVYFLMNDFDNAEIYFKKAFDLSVELQGEHHVFIGTIYNNFGKLFFKKNEFDRSEINFNKALERKINVYGIAHPDVATIHLNLAEMYLLNKNFDSARISALKALNIFLSVFSYKHPMVSNCYNRIGDTYIMQNNYFMALKNYHYALYANLKSLTDSSDLFAIPDINDYTNSDHLLTTLKGKAECLSALHAKLNNLKYLESTLNNYQLCDIVIDKVRPKIKNRNDKIYLANKASGFYDSGIQVCLELAKNSTDQVDIGKYRQNAFYFSEKNKTGVLLESMNDVKAKTFAGIPDSVLEKGHQLKIDITFNEKQVAEGPDSAKEVLYRDRLFKLNQDYDQFTKNLETNYPQYYNLKYQTKTVTIQELQQKVLNKKTALIEYFIGDSMLYQFIVTDKDYQIIAMKKDTLFEKEIKSLRNSIIRNDYASYTRSAYKAYQWLMQPSEKWIKGKDLIIIPDGMLGYIPFEALLTEEITKQKEYDKLPYLVKDHAVSYAYSATLLYETLNKPVQTASNDFVAYAPVFSDESKAGYVSTTHELFREEMKTDSTRAMMRSGGYIPAIPATKDEVNNIFGMFNDKQMKAKVYTYGLAKEANIKTDDLSKYKYVHFATHGFVSEDKPELSGIVMAQDTASKEDGILYSGEIYNLKLNADMVVLSACETGLGKVVKGEGIIGLTRGFLYAGTNSLVVSLWKVADQSTSNLMVDFYGQLIKKNDKPTSLRTAKLNMIKSKQFASPYYWSPFVMIGK